MNDAFLYRIRTEPPPHFARTLKARLDHTPRRNAKFANLGIGVFLFGTAFALVSPAAREMIAGWFAAQPDEREIAQLVVPKAGDQPSVPPPDVLAADAPEPSAPEPPLEGEFPPDRVRSELVPVSAGAIVDTERPTPEQRAARLMELLDEVERHLAAQSAPSFEPDSAAAVEELESSPSEFIVTGPLLAEPRTAAYAFQQRRALFTVITWTMEPVTATLKKQSLLDNARKIEVSGRRLEQLARMIPDAFAHDTSKSEVPTRALDRVWKEPDLFARRVQELQVAARLLTMAAQQGNEMGIRQAATRVTIVCMKCHEDFREHGNTDVGALYP